MQKKLLSLLLIFSMCCLGGCFSRPYAVDITELLIRMERTEGEAVPDLEEAFFSDDKWFLYLDVCADNDMLLSATEGKGHILSQVSLTALNTEEENKASRFRDLCRCLVDAFTDNEISEKLCSGAGLYDDIIFSEEVRFYEEGKYKLSFYNNPLGSTLIIELTY